MSPPLVRPRKIAQKLNKENLLLAWGDGRESIYSLAKNLGVCNKELKRLLIDYKIIPFCVSEELAHLSKEVLEREYLNLDIKDIAKKYGTSQSTINILFDHFFITRKYTIYNVNEDFFNLEEPESFYIAGLWAADGCVSWPKGCKQPSKIQIGLKSEDKNHLEMVKSLVGYSGPLYYKDNKYPSYSLEIGSHKMCQSLVKFGIGERKSLTYKMPEWLMNHKYINHFLYGYFDGDGCVYIRPNGYDAQISIRGTVDHLTQINEILLKNKICSTENKVIRMSSGIGRLVYGGIPLCCLIYEYFMGEIGIGLLRKKEKYNTIKSKDIKVKEAKRKRND